MSSSDAEEFEKLAKRALEIAERALESENTAEISDEAVQNLLTAGARLFTRKTEMEDRVFLPFVSTQACTATDVCQTTSEMLRAVNLNTFDLTMWYSRPRPEGAP
jgi:methyltransferase-like protein